MRYKKASETNTYLIRALVAEQELLKRQIQDKYTEIRAAHLAAGVDPDTQGILLVDTRGLAAGIVMSITTGQPVEEPEPALPPNGASETPS